jgi:hypothetical protein
MKTIITFLTATMLVAGASGAMASDWQATDDALNYAISHQANVNGNYASARVSGTSHNGAVKDDFQMDGR